MNIPLLNLVGIVALIVLVLVVWREKRGSVRHTGKFLVEAELLFTALKKYFEWAEKHGQLNDKHKADIESALTSMRRAVGRDLPDRVKVAVKEAAAEVAAEHDSGPILLPPGSLPPLPKKDP